MARTYVYFNLHRSCWSLMFQGKVTGHSTSLVGSHVDFVVRPAGHARVLREGVKNVHAFVAFRGALAPTDDATMPHVDGEPIEVSYNPRKGASFYNKATGEAVVSAEWVVMTSDRKVYAWGAK